MRIKEQLIIGKKSQEECEDGIVVNDNFAAVIDGSTSKTAMRMNGIYSNGRYCMELIKQYIESLPADVKLAEFCNNVTELIYSEYVSHNADIERLRMKPEERLTASAIVYSRHFRQVWMIGDCQCVVNGRYYDNPKPYEQALATKRSHILHDAINRGMTVAELQKKDCGRDAILEELIECCGKQNLTYAVIDGFSIPMDKVAVVDVGENTSEIVLASDGYPFLMPTLEESENALSQQLAEDPLCINRFKATKGLMSGYKSFDDRSYLRISV